uniref:Muscular LMNA-interacting protein n=1 Tax=Sphenodon punctatus TaxID=8508 RepID=A0A8D0GHF4_SPHPU
MIYKALHGLGPSYLRDRLTLRAPERLLRSAGGVPSDESGQLTFTFVPSVGRLPTHCEVAEATKFLGSSALEPVDDSNQEIRNRSVVADGLALESGNRQESGSTCHVNSSHKIFHQKGQNTSKGAMQENDLFKAEFVFIMDSDEGDEDITLRNQGKQSTVGNGYEESRSQLLPSSQFSAGDELRKHVGELNLPDSQHTELFHGAAGQQNQCQQYKIKTSYKAFAAIPTNTLLMEQKALDEPAKIANVTEDRALDTHSELCSPAQLRQQTEELCAAIDQVLQDPLPMVPVILLSHLQMSAMLQRAPGRETRYVSPLQIYVSTKPGVIRPAAAKARIILKKEEPYQPNPFRKYLEETRSPDIEQVITILPETTVLHPLYQTKLIPPTKSPLHPQSISPADCLTPGPFSHLSSMLSDLHEHSYSPYSRNALYNKLSMSQ